MTGLRSTQRAQPVCPYCGKELVISGAFLVCPRPFATARCEVYAKRRPGDEFVTEVLSGAEATAAGAAYYIPEPGGPNLVSTSARTWRDCADSETGETPCNPVDNGDGTATCSECGWTGGFNPDGDPA